MTPRYSPAELASALGLFAPTDEQAAVIAAPPGPLVVIAGAGAGKTETMAARVVWLVANGYARPAEVLGLTFTRKAAGQLLRRVRARLARLAGSGLMIPGTDSLGLTDDPVILGETLSFDNNGQGFAGAKFIRLTSNNFLHVREIRANVAIVPEPTTSLLGIGLAGVCALIRPNR